jgi:outer membrane protein OmpA-like peptidoglycan-associated protein
MFLFTGIQVTFAQSIINEDGIKKAKIFSEHNINTANLESSPAFIGDKIGFVFTSGKGKLFDKEIDEAFFDLALSEVNPDNTLKQGKIFGKRINSELHEGPLCYDLNTNKMYFTRSHKDKKLASGKEADTTYLRILSADLNPSTPDVKPININVERYSVCHPSLSLDGKTMVFASDKPGGFGGYDLYMAFCNDNQWSGIINLGPEINTAANEVFPFLLNDSIILFSSHREHGAGGLDIYVSAFQNGFWASAEILPKPFNSAYDDLSLIVRENLKSGYFSSNRPGGAGKDDLYRFESEKPIFGKKEDELEATVVTIMDKLTLEGIGKVNFTVTPLDIDINNYALSSYNVDMLSGRNPGELLLKLSPKKGQKHFSYQSNDDGKIEFKVKRGQKYLLTAAADQYTDISIIFDFSLFGKNFNMVMEPKVSEVEEITPDTAMTDIVIPTEVGNKVVFDQIYYDYSSSIIKPGAARELDALAKVMSSRPEMKVRLEAHTDSRGSKAFNLQLSINRANAARDYLIGLGISDHRINIRGFGESKLRNECDDQTPCSDQKHAYNRRTEVIIEE